MIQMTFVKEHSCPLVVEVKRAEVRTLERAIDLTLTKETLARFWNKDVELTHKNKSYPNRCFFSFL